MEQENTSTVVSQQDDDIPDWLRGSEIDTEVTEQETPPQDISPSVKQEVTEND